MVTRREQLGTLDHQREDHDDEKPETSGRRRRSKKAQGNGEGKEENKDNKTRSRLMKRPASAKTSRANKSPQERSAESAPVQPKAKKATKPKKAAMTDKEQKDEKETPEPKTEKRPRPGTNQKKKEDNGEKKESTTKEPKDVNGEGDGSGPAAKVPKVSRTWAGRWIPSDPVALGMMTSIRTVFDSLLKHKFNSPSTLASPFYSQCIKSYKAKGLDNAQSTSEQLVAAAELEVEPFLQLESIRTWTGLFCFMSMSFLL